MNEEILKKLQELEDIANYLKEQLKLLRKEVANVRRVLSLR